MKGLMRRGKPGEGILMCYVAEVVRIDLGIGQDSETQEMYPSLDLDYRDLLHPGVLAIAWEMEQKGQLPKVHLVNRGAYLDVYIVFHLKYASRELLETLVTDALKEQVFKEIGDERVAVYTVAHTSLLNRHAKHFLEPFRRGPSFRLHLVRSEGGQNKAVWGVELKSYETLPPNEEDLAP